MKIKILQQDIDKAKAEAREDKNPLANNFT